MKRATLAVFTGLIMLSCQSEKSAVESIETNNYELADNSMTSLDWNGTYKGTLPCADCEGIEITLTIKSNGEFQKSSKYLGKDENILFETGTFEWDEKGRNITLTTESGDNQIYQVGENILFHLDQEGNRITGNLEEMYRLIKNHADFFLEDRKWVLTELRGQSYELKADEKEVFLFFENETARFYGNTGCNAINGPYEIKEGSRISFGNVASTMMACPSMDNDRVIAELLAEVDNYSIADGQLSLNKARMAPLARFTLIEE